MYLYLGIRALSFIGLLKVNPKSFKIYPLEKRMKRESTKEIRRQRMEGLMLEIFEQL